MPDAQRIEIQVLRYRPEEEDKPVWQSYYVPFTNDMSVLQGLQYIKDELDGSLTFRWSCRMAICGSCGVMVNDVPHLGCRTFLRDFAPGPVRIEALAHFPIERDLVVDAEDFVTKLAKIKPWIVPKEERTLEAGPYLQTPSSSRASSPSATASTACSATRPARNTASTRSSSVPGSPRCCIATTATRGTARRTSAWTSCTRRRACGAAPPWATAPRSAPRRSIPPAR